MCLWKHKKQSKCIMEHVKKRDPFGVVPQWIGLIQTASNASIVYKQTSENIGKKIIQLCF